MALLFEVEQAIEALFYIDPETGEVLFDEAALEALQMERGKILEQLALKAKNSRAEAAAYKAEKMAFEARQRQAERTADKCEALLTNSLNGEKFKTSKVAISFRKSQKVQIDETFLPIDYWTPQPPKANLTLIKQDIKAGKEVVGAWLVDCQNIQIR